MEAMSVDQGIKKKKQLEDNIPQGQKLRSISLSERAGDLLSQADILLSSSDPMEIGTRSWGKAG